MLQSTKKFPLEVIMSVGSEFIVLTSRVSGLIEWGPVLGQYSLLGTHNGSPCYKQTDTISSDAIYIYKDILLNFKHAIESGPFPDYLLSDQLPSNIGFWRIS